MIDIYSGATKGNFVSEFPEITEFTMEVNDTDLFGWDGTYRKSIYTMDNPPPFTIPCSNSLCQRGGLDAYSMIRAALRSENNSHEETTKCPGDEGSPKGRRQGKFCHHGFEVKVTISKCR